VKLIIISSNEGRDRLAHGHGRQREQLCHQLCLCANCHQAKHMIIGTKYRRPSQSFTRLYKNCARRWALGAPWLLPTWAAPQGRTRCSSCPEVLTAIRAPVPQCSGRCGGAVFFLNDLQSQVTIVGIIWTGPLIS
jgi:hypothetical protein